VSVRVAAVAPDVVEVRIDNPCGDGAGGGGLHMALANVRARLEGHFGAAASLREAVVEGRHRVCLRLPAAAGILERP
jgi:LytS/YehU family sensor histidine kinase